MFVCQDLYLEPLVINNININNIPTTHPLSQTGIPSRSATISSTYSTHAPVRNMYPWEGTEMIKSIIIIFWDSVIHCVGWRVLEYPALRQSTASPINHYSKSKQRFMSSNTTISNLYLYWEKYLQQQPVILPQIICLITAGVGRSQTPDRVLSWSWEGWWLWQGSSSTHQLIFISLEHYVPDTVCPTLAYNKQMLTAITTFELSPNIIFLSRWEENSKRFISWKWFIEDWTPDLASSDHFNDRWWLSTKKHSSTILVFRLYFSRKW